MERDLPKVDLETLVQQIEAEKAFGEVLRLEDQVIDLEITEQCYTNCEECYTDGRANPKGKEVPLEVIAERLAWIKRFTNAKHIYLLGGEPLLHSRLPQILDLIRAEGFDVNVITSGVVSVREREKVNLDYLLALYEKGDVYLNLSYHPKRNEKAFKEIYDRCRQTAEKRIANLKAKKIYLEEAIKDLKSKPASAEVAWQLLFAQEELKSVETNLSKNILYSTVTLAETVIQDENDFISVFAFMYGLEGVHLENLTLAINDDPKLPALEVIKKQYSLFKKHFGEFTESMPYQYRFWVDWAKDLRFYFRFWGATTVKTELVNGKPVRVIKRPMGTSKSPQMCPAMDSNFDEPDKIKIQGLLVRSDGEITFSEPSCIEVKRGFANVDTDFDPVRIYQKVKTRVQSIDKLIHMVDRKHLSGREDDGDCHSCPFDSACRLCHK